MNLMCALTLVSWLKECRINVISQKDAFSQALMEAPKEIMSWMALPMQRLIAHLIFCQSPIKLLQNIEKRERHNSE